MAEVKKPDKGGGKPAAKPAAPSAPSMESTIVLVIIVAVMVIFIVLPAVLQLFGFSGNFLGDFWEKLQERFMAFITAISFVSIFLSLVFICGLVYAQVMYAEAKRQLELVNGPKPKIHIEEPGPQNLGTSGPDPRWRDIEGLMQSTNTADWRIAILEADILLDDMLTQMGYQGNSIGDKLKQVDRNHFKTLNDAWNAHKVRNTIAHEGASYELTRSEAEGTVALFKKVFNEFYFI